jgi:hypothetical protein
MRQLSRYLAARGGAALTTEGGENMSQEVSVPASVNGQPADTVEHVDVSEQQVAEVIPRVVVASGLYRMEAQVLSDWTPIHPGVTSVDGDGVEPQLDAGDMETDLDTMPAYAGSTEFGLKPPPIPLRMTEELRIDVDGQYPQMVASGTIRGWLTGQLHWIARLTHRGRYVYQGTIFHKDGDVNLLPHTALNISISPNRFPAQQRARVTFLGAGQPITRIYSYSSRYFRKVEFEFDRVQDTSTVTTIQTHAHPNRPATLPREKLTIERVFERAGFQVSKSGGDSVIPLALAGANQTWSNQEMHDAMQVHWSRFANKPQWSMWTLWAGQHDMGPSLGGIMFDSIGPNHRQGTAIFMNSFISQAPAGESNPTEWVRRMQFWTAVHEMGHSFNLAHSWQKSLGTPWIPLANEPEARSFMNYPYNVNGGQQQFFSDFDYRFSNAELLFMRHAPERFVQMGNANWFDHHGFQQAAVQYGSNLSLELRIQRDRMEFAFLEPINLELKITNIGTRPVMFDAAAIHSLDSVTVISKRDRDPARQFLPFARYCLEPQPTVLHPGESLYSAIEPSAGIEGWDIGEPGRYLIQLAVHLEDQDLVSNPLTIRVAPPRSYDEEYVAQDYFTEEVGRILAFEGSRVLTAGNAVLHEVRERFPENPAARHASHALAAPLIRASKILTVPEDREGATLGEVGAQFSDEPADEATARQLMDDALIEVPDTAANSFGHIPYKEHADEYSKALALGGDTQHAAEVQGALRAILEARGVIQHVLDEISSHQRSLEQGVIPEEWSPGERSS